MTHTWSRVALPIFINLLPCPLSEHEVNVLMGYQRCHGRGVISAAMEVVNCGDVHGDSTESVQMDADGVRRVGCEGENKRDDGLYRKDRDVTHTGGVKPKCP